MEKYKAKSNDYLDDELDMDEEIVSENFERDSFEEPIVTPQFLDSTPKSNISSNIHNDYKSRIYNLRKNNDENNAKHSMLNKTRQNETRGINKTSSNKVSTGGLLGGKGKSKSSGPITSNITGKLMDKIPPALKIKIYAGLALIVLSLLIFVTVFAEEDEINLGATNNAALGSALSSNSNFSTVCTEAEIENKLVYLGDSRIVGLEQTINKDNVTYIAESGMGYNWLVDTARGELDVLLQENPNRIVVLALGANGLGASNYVNYYNQLFSDYPDTTFFVMSVNPVDESKTAANGYTLKNSQIEEFNNEMKNAFPDQYIDSYNGVSEYETGDGVHYNASTNKKVHDHTINSIKSSNKVMCGGGGDLISKLNDIGNWYVENVTTYTCHTDGNFYNCRTPYDNPFTGRAYGDDCTEFATAYMAYVAGQDISSSFSGGMVDPNGAWAQEVAKLNWKSYTSDEIGSLQPGDVLIAH